MIASLRRNPAEATRPHTPARGVFSFAARPRFPRPTRRGGAVLVEAAVIITVFLVLILGGIDLLLAVYRNNTLSQAARYGARQAIVRGALATSPATPWGPASYSGTAGDGSQYASAVGPMLIGFPLNDVNLTFEWPDGNNAVGSRVRVRLNMTYRPLLGFIYGNQTYQLTGASTMPIAH